MALINCPECNKQISDQAPACIQCGYPLSTKSSARQPSVFPSENNPAQHSELTNKDIVVALTSKKSEGLAFIFAFLFGPLGLFYADSKKAVIVIIAAFIVALLSMVFDQSNSLYIGITIIFWILSIFIAMSSVSEYNNKISSVILADENNIEASPVNQASTDSIQELHRKIYSAQGNSMVPSSLKENIINLINEICEDKAACYFLLKEYKHRYSSDLVEDLKKLSNSYDTIKSYVKPFIDFGFVAKDYPHKPL